TLVDDALETLGTHDFDGALVGPMTAHPKVDPATGELHFFGYSAMAPYLRYHVADAGGRLIRSLDIDLPNPVMMHDFAITEHHVVFFDAPALFDLSGFLGGGPMIRWEPDLGTRIGVMRRDGDGSDLRWAEVEPCYVFHFLNAWSDGSTLVLDGCRLPRLDIGLEAGTEPAPTSGSSSDGSSSDGSSSDGGGHLSRFTVDLDTFQATTTQLTDLRGDFPRIDERAAGREHRFGYLATIVDPRSADDPGASNPEEGAFDSVTRIDLADGTTHSHRFGPGRTCGEPVFAPDPSRDGQDGGWLLTWVHDAATDRSDLVVLDAADVEAAPVATVHAGRRVPFGFHGAWLPDDGRLSGTT
ncbi:MAG: carotenoid oxygenase family protein, partial [Actinomycetota bacterium]|nr:carotenoid oxygenase family protein [Actinomycetota bacterium]